MAQTKRKRRTKHRGNAAGVVESRGRTGRRPTQEETRKAGREAARGRRDRKPPSWNGAFLKAALMAAVLFLFTRLGVFGSEATIAQAITMCAFAILLYTPLAYYTDRWVYQRAKQKQQ